jgi:hypothetical protein
LVSASFALPVLSVIVPPEFAVEPSPVTVSPAEPALFRKIPFGAPFELMLLNVSPLAPIVVVSTLSGVPVVVVSVFAVEPVTVTVPPAGGGEGGVRSGGER